MNSTTYYPLPNTKDYYIVCFMSSAFAFVALVVSLIIISTVIHTKPRLHTVRHLLVCNTCVASILYCLVQPMNYIILIFFPNITDDVSCRWRGYFSYVSVCAVIYSYLVQAISRLFFSVWSRKHPSVTSFKVHRILILINWIAVLVIPLPALITNDIYYRPGLLCWVPMAHFIHVVYTIASGYIAPVVPIIIIYVIILKLLKKTKRRSEFLRNTTNEKRDLEVLRNIVVLLGIYIAGAIPTLLYLATSIEIFYLSSIVTITSAVSIEKIFTILLDRELRQVMKSFVYPNNQVTPFQNTITRAAEHRGTVHLQRAYH